MLNPIEYNENEQLEIMQICATFLTNIATITNDDTAYKMFQTFEEALPAEMHGRTFIMMLTGDYKRSICFTTAHINFQDGINRKVPMIKAIRAATGLGLKQAKVIADDSMVRYVDVKVDADMRDILQKELSNLGANFRLSM